MGSLDEIGPGHEPEGGSAGTRAGADWWQGLGLFRAFQVGVFTGLTAIGGFGLVAIVRSVDEELGSVLAPWLPFTSIGPLFGLALGLCLLPRLRKEYGQPAPVVATLLMAGLVPLLVAVSLVLLDEPITTFVGCGLVFLGLVYGSAVYVVLAPTLAAIAGTVLALRPKWRALGLVLLLLAVVGARSLVHPSLLPLLLFPVGLGFLIRVMTRGNFELRRGTWRALAAVTLAAVSGLVLAALHRAALLPPPERYVASLPVVGRLPAIPAGEGAAAGSMPVPAAEELVVEDRIMGALFRSRCQGQYCKVTLESAPGQAESFSADSMDGLHGSRSFYRDQVDRSANLVVARDQDLSLWFLHNPGWTIAFRDGTEETVHIEAADIAAHASPPRGWILSGVCGLVLGVAAFFRGLLTATAHGACQAFALATVVSCLPAAPLLATAWIGLVW